MTKRSGTWALTSLLALLLSAAPGGCSCGEEEQPSGPAPSPSVTPPGAGLNVTDASVRACDILLKVSGDEVPKVRFGTGVTGQFIPKAPRLAISIAANSDASLVGQELAALIFEQADQSAELVRVQCFDSAGSAVSGTPLRLD